jgi:hypothetical protein
MTRRSSAINISAIAILALALGTGGAVGASKARVNKNQQLVGSWTIVSVTPSSPTAQAFGPNDGVLSLMPEADLLRCLRSLTY